MCQVLVKYTEYHILTLLLVVKVVSFLNICFLNPVFYFHSHLEQLNSEFSRGGASVIYYPVDILTKSCDEGLQGLKQQSDVWESTFLRGQFIPNMQQSTVCLLGT